MGLGWSKSFWRIATPEDERRSRSLSYILIFMVAFTTLVTLPQVWMTQSAPWQQTSLRIIGIYMGCLLIARLFSRTRYFRLSALMAVVAGILGAAGSLYFGKLPLSHIGQIVLWLQLNGLLTSMFLSQRIFVTYAIISVAVLGFAPWIIENVEFDTMGLYIVACIELNVLLYANLILRRKDLEHIEGERQAIVQAEKMSALGEMSANIAHEINNPLAILHGMAGKLQRQVEENQLDRDQLMALSRQMRNTTMRIAKIVRGLNDFARNTPSDQSMGIYELRSLVEQSIQVCESKLRHSEISVQNNVPPGFLVSAHETQLVQVMVNLITNAIHAASKEGNPWIQFNASQEEDALVKLSISDNGSGVHSSIREKIMEPYFTTKPPGEGTGIGLSLSRMLVQRHGGELFLDSEASYTTFVVKLPTVPQEMRVLT